LDLELIDAKDILYPPEELNYTSKEILQRLGKIYDNFNMLLKDNNFITQWKITKLLSSMDFKVEGKYFFIGFFALTRAEEGLLKKFYHQGATFYWHADPENLPDIYKRWIKNWNINEADIKVIDGEEWILTHSEKGIELPLQVTLATKNDQSEPEVAQALKELAAPAGFEISLDITESGGYWDRWTEVPLGITSWTHRPLATMVLPLAYTEESIGAWNETRWFDDEFTTLLREAEATLDVEARRSIMCKMEDIMQERGPVANSFWKNVWNITNSDFEGVQAHPTAYDLMYEVWKNV